MILNSKQEQGLKLAVSRYKNGERQTVIAGYAGTGKSTLVRFIIEALGLDENEVCFACYTGKAAEVLRKKGNDNAMTVHRLLYDHFPKPDGTFIRKKKIKFDEKLIVVDECSMLPVDMVKELRWHKESHIIYLGDPFQLPPIKDEDNNHLLDNPDIFLDEIMRQEAESEIIRVSMDIRQGNPLKLFRGNEVQILDKKDLNTGMLLWADTVITATNKKRHLVNQTIRQELGYTEPIVEGEKITCLRNYWDKLDDSYDAPLVNGTIGTLHNAYKSFNVLPPWSGNKMVDIMCGDFVSESGDTYSSLKIDRNMIFTEKKTLDNKTAWRLSKNPKTAHLIPLEFTYAYGITCHRAQGSEWDKVLVIEEGFPFDREEHARWLYTACTRAADKLVLVRK